MYRDGCCVSMFYITDGLAETRNDKMLKAYIRIAALLNKQKRVVNLLRLFYLCFT